MTILTGLGEELGLQLPLIEKFRRRWSEERNPLGEMSPPAIDAQLGILASE
jgi:hypothetical protein